MAGNQYGTGIAPAVIPMAQQRRRVRRPSHPFALRHRAFALQPFLVAPVQAGETLKSALVQHRTVTDPVKSAVTGWWLEHFLFYVKISQTTVPTDFLFTPGYAIPGGNLVTADSEHRYQVYTAGETNINWLGECMKPIVTHYFRSDDEDESLAAGKWTDTYIAGRVGVDIFESAMLQSVKTGVTDVNVDLNSSGTIMVGEIEQAFRQYQLAKQNNLTSMTFEDYLAQQGVNVPSEKFDAGKPELLRVNRDWTYPSNTIEPTTGAAASAASWAGSMRADKDRFFSEPGFLIGVQLCRPKVYLSAQNGTLSGFLNSANKWLPRWLNQDALAAIEDIAVASGSVDNPAAISIDLRDLFERGEQFIGGNIANGKIPVLATSDNNGVGRYPVLADVTALFVDGVTNYHVRTDGVVDLAIATALPKDPLRSIDTVF
ncbi:major capsid protein [Microviridae sp.]|nr:major capsid protein [Microviridae sp.]